VELRPQRRIYFHEDDYCQQEILPIENWSHCAKQINEIVESSKKSFDGTSWGSMVLREENPKRLVELGISLERIGEVLQSRLPKYDLVQTGYGSYVENCENTEGYGFDGGFDIFVRHNAAGIVNAIWCNPWGFDRDAVRESKKSILDVFDALSAEYELLFVDWAWSRMFKLNDRYALEQYLDEHIHRSESTHK